MEFLNKKAVTLEFIQKYRSYPELWDIRHKDYTNRGKKCKAYEKLVEVLKKIDNTANREIVVKKINSLRSNFRKEFNKVRSSKFRNSTEDYQPSLWYYNEFLFITDHEIPNNSRFILNQNVSEEMTGVVREAGYHQQSSENSRFACTKRKRSTADQMFSYAVKHLEKEDDEFSILAKGYAQKLRKMEPLQRLFADRLINEVLLEGQLQNLTRHSSITATNYCCYPTVASPCVSDASAESSNQIIGKMDDSAPFTIVKTEE